MLIRAPRNTNNCGFETKFFRQTRFPLLFFLPHSSPFLTLFPFFPFYMHTQTLETLAFWYTWVLERLKEREGGVGARELWLKDEGKRERERRERGRERCSTLLLSPLPSPRSRTFGVVLNWRPGAGVHRHVECDWHQKEDNSAAKDLSAPNNSSDKKEKKEERSFVRAFVCSFCLCFVWTTTSNNNGGFSAGCFCSIFYRKHRQSRWRRQYFRHKIWQPYFLGKAAKCLSS